MGILVGGSIPVVPLKYEFDYRDKTVKNKHFEILLEGSKKLNYQSNHPPQMSGFDWDLDARDLAYS